MAKVDEHALTKTDVIPAHPKTLGYEHHKRACMVYSHWRSGYTEEEISDFMELDIDEIRKDLQHINVTLPVRRIIQDNNDRSRIMLQRQEQINYNKLLGEALQTDSAAYLQAGISPAGILKEFREAVGLTQKPQPLIQVNTQQNYLGEETHTGAGVRSAEDAIRKVLAEMERDESQEVIDVEPEESESEEEKE